MNSIVERAGIVSRLSLGIERSGGYRIRVEIVVEISRNRAVKVFERYRGIEVSR